MKNDSFLLKRGTFVGAKYSRILLAGTLVWLVALIDSCADTFVAGIYINENAVSGISLITPILSLFCFLCYLVSMGTSIMYSREAGAFRYEHAYKIVGQGFICTVVVSVILVVSLFFMRDPLMQFYNPSAEVLEYALQYYDYQIYFAIIYPVYYLISQLVTIDGDDLLSLIGTIASAIANLVLSVALVDKMGVRGLALSTVIGSFLGCFIYSLHFLRKTNSVKIKFQFVWKDFLEMMKLSSSTSMTLLYLAAIDIIFNKYIISAYTDAYLPAYSVINLVLNIGSIFASTYDASAGFVTVAMGEKNPNGIKTTMKIATVFSVIESLVAFVLLEVLAPFFPSLFGITDPAVCEASVLASRVIALSCIATALYYLYSGYYPTIGRVAMGNIVSAIYMLITPLVIAIPLSESFGFNGLIWGFALTSIITVILAIIYIRIRYGRKAVPLILEPSMEEFLCYEIVLNDENISHLCEKVNADLIERKINSSVINEICLVIEESYMKIKEKNGNKKILTECSIFVSNESVRVITKDNGKIFDITDADASIKDFRSFVLARLMERNEERNHVTTISFNRNSYYWKLT